jgi:glycosyltransferase involved in cell wall biosynthesis
MKTQNNKVAVVMGAYNCEKYVERSIRAMIEQSHKDWELFVTNDCSTDNTSAVIQKLVDENLQMIKSMDPQPKWRINLLQSPKNSGCDNARNFGIDEILKRKDEFSHVAICDSDDVWNVHHLKDAIETLDREDAGMYYSSVSFQDSNDQPIEVYGIPKFDTFDRTNLVKQNFVFVSSVVIRIQHLVKFDQFCDPKGDWDMWLRLSEKTKVIYSGYVGSKYRWKNEGSYYNEDQSNESKLKVEIKHGLYYGKEDLIKKLEIVKKYKEHMTSIFNTRMPDYDLYAALQRYEKEMSALLKLEEKVPNYPEPRRVIKYNVVVHPYSHVLPNNSGKPNPKNYPHWKETVELLKERGFYVVQIGIAGEPLIGADEVVLNANTKRLKEVLDNSDTFICVDSFFQHFAKYHGRNGVVIFGPSDPKIFGHKDNFNMLKDRKYLRPNQFSTWNECEYRDDIFVSPVEIVNVVEAMVSTINSVPAT